MSRDHYQGRPDNYPYTTSPTATKYELHIYADGDNGDDANKGFSFDAPKKTLQAALDLVPNHLEHFCCVHLSGTFTLTDYANLVIPSRSCHNPYAYVLITGDEDAVTVVDDNSGSNYTATAAATTSVSVAGAGWRDEQHAGYLVEFLTGDAAGYKTACFGGTDTTLYLGKLPVSPGVGATFRMVKPATRITSTVAYKGLRFYGGSTTDPASGYSAFLANVEVDGQAYVGMYNTTGTIALRNVFVNTTGSISFSVIAEGAHFAATTAKASSTDGSMSYDAYHFGLSVHSLKNVDLRDILVTSVLYNSWIKPKLYVSSGSVEVGYNTVVSGSASFKGVTGGGQSGSFGRNLFESSTAYGHTARMLGGTTIMGSIEGTTVENVHMSNPSGPALTVLGSNITLGAVTGSGSTFGAQVGRGSFVSLSAAPTLTGPSGYLTFDGSTVTSGTWASIKAGGAVSNTTEMSTVKTA